VDAAAVFATSRSHEESGTPPAAASHAARSPAVQRSSTRASFSTYVHVRTRTDTSVVKLKNTREQATQNATVAPTHIYTRAHAERTRSPHELARTLVG
jgi:hypothetical protein